MTQRIRRVTVKAHITNNQQEHQAVVDERDNQPPLAFVGKCLGMAVGTIDREQRIESVLWLSDSGDLVCENKIFSHETGEQIVCEAKACKDSSEVAKFLNYDQDYGAGHGENLYLIAKRLDYAKYKPLGVAHVG